MRLGAVAISTQQSSIQPYSQSRSSPFSEDEFRRRQDPAGFVIYSFNAATR